MAAVNALMIRDAVVHQLVRREKSWPAREPGVMVVLCITFVGMLLRPIDAWCKAMQC